jgi:hypothetical protein
MILGPTTPYIPVRRAFVGHLASGEESASPSGGASIATSSSFTQALPGSVGTVCDSGEADADRNRSIIVALFLAVNPTVQLWDGTCLTLKSFRYREKLCRTDVSGQGTTTLDSGVSALYLLCDVLGCPIGRPSIVRQDHESCKYIGDRFFGGSSNHPFSELPSGHFFRWLSLNRWRAIVDQKQCGKTLVKACRLKAVSVGITRSSMIPH